MSLGILLLVIIGVSLVILMIWNLLSLNQLKKRGQTNRNLDDPKCYELKYKQEFFIATVSLVGTVLVIFGYNSLQNVEKALKEDFAIKTASISKQTDSIINRFDTSLNRRITATDKSLQFITASSAALLSRTDNQLLNTQKSLTGYNRQLSELSKQQDDVDTKFKNVQNRISEINSKNILKQNFYLVDSLLFDTRIMDTAKTDDSYYTTYYFKDMRTINGDKLPQFKKPPFVIATLQNTNTAAPAGTIRDVTIESFKFSVTSWMEGRSRIMSFGIFISEKP